MDADDDDHGELQNTEDVRIVGPRVGPIEELGESTCSKAAVDPHDGSVQSEDEVEQIGRQKTGEIHLEAERLELVPDEFPSVGHD